MRQGPQPVPGVPRPAALAAQGTQQLGGAEGRDLVDAGLRQFQDVQEIAFEPRKEGQLAQTVQVSRLDRLAQRPVDEQLLGCLERDAVMERRDPRLPVRPELDQIVSLFYDPSA
ncbi:hypothetical protein D3C72_971400 [compost metagenome]